MLTKSIFILIVLLNILSISAQTDTITYAECEIDTIPNQYDKLLKYFMVEKEDVKHLWKFNAVDWGTLNPSIAFEQRILKPLSVEFETKFSTTNFLLYNPKEVIYMDDAKFKAEVNGEFRFYFNKKKRERKGKNTNGFSANYLFFGGGINTYNRTSFYSGSNETFDKWDVYVDVKLGMGIQRRIGSIGYADIKFGAYARDSMGEGDDSSNAIHGMEMQDFFIDINLGIALKSLKRPLFK